MREYHELRKLLEQCLRDFYEDNAEEIIRQWLERKAREIATEEGKVSPFLLIWAKELLGIKGEGQTIGFEKNFKPSPVCNHEDGKAFRYSSTHNLEVCYKCGEKKPSPVAGRVWCEDWISTNDGWARDGKIPIAYPNFCDRCGAPRPAEKPRTLAERLAEVNARELAKPRSDINIYEAFAKESEGWFREKIESVPKHAFSPRLDTAFIDKIDMLREIEL